ncbi:MAG: hypothetical protein WBH82_00550, partial [Arcanobacterium sp.]
KLWGAHKTEIINGDFLKISPRRILPADLVIANPPYVRHHHISTDLKKAYKREVIDSIGYAPTGLAGLYVYFLLASHRYMKPGAIGVWLIPSEFLDTNYGQAIRRYLAKYVTTYQIHQYDVNTLQFDDALVTSTVVLFQNSPATPNHHVSFSTGQALETPTSNIKIPQSILDPNKKWGSLFTGTISHLYDRARITKFGDYFKVSRGIATGNNKYFVRTRQEVQALGILSKELQPLLPPPRRLKINHVKSGDDGWPTLDEQLVLLSSDLPLEQLRVENPALAAYFEEVDEKTANAYLVRNRTPWYKVESRKPAPFLLTYMGRAGEDNRPFRFIQNDSKAIVTNGYLMLYPAGELKNALVQNRINRDDVFNFLASISGKDLCNAGRVYGGGLRKIEPKELLNMPVPGITRLLEIRETA